MQIKWYGHSAFLLTAANGARVLMDPCDASTGYDLKDIACDVVTSSHGHFDHNYFAAATGDPVIINTVGTQEAAGLRFTGIQTYHDEVNGAKRGENVVFVVEMDGLRVVHMGDIGHELEEETIKAIGTPDVLMIPVGGTFTVDAAQAVDMAAALGAKVVIPMHYMTPALGFAIAGVEPFLALAQGTVMELESDTCELQAEDLPQNTVMVLQYA